MVKVGDKVKIKAVRHGGDLSQVNDVVTVTGMIYERGFMAITSTDEEVYVCYDFDDSCADYLAGHIVATETEAERRGAKFGVMGVVKDSGTRISFVKEYNGLWRVFDENGIDYDSKPSEIRLDHEPECVAWLEAPEHLRYDASRVYYDGEPVKWIAKPEGAWSNVAFVNHYGFVQGSPDDLTVKL